MRLPLLVALLFPAAALAADFSVESGEVKPNAKIAEAQVYKGFGCEGGNVSPSLSWKNVPAGTKSFVVMMYDPDAPTGSGWWHWVVYNIPVDITSLPSGAGDVASGKIPKPAVQSRTDFGKPGYGGPCPPQGDKPHRYIFTVYALKIEKLPDVDENASPAMIGFMSNANKLGKATLQGMYGRK
jgi:Raf kinase inhibitor-like YbhB/YbcL family protein